MCPVLAYEVEKSAHLAPGLLKPPACLWRERRFKDCGLFKPGEVEYVVEYVPDVIGLGGMQGSSRVKESRKWGEDAQNLVKSSTEPEAEHEGAEALRVLVRLHHGRLSQAQNERLCLVEGVCLQELPDQSGENGQLLDHRVLAEPRGCLVYGLWFMVHGLWFRV